MDSFLWLEDDNTTCITVTDEKKECNSYIFDNQTVGSTITTENSLVCKQKWISQIITVSTMIGMVIGKVLKSDQNKSKKNNERIN